MHITVTGPSLDERRIIKNLFVYYRYELLPFITAGPGAVINRYGVIDGDTARTHEEAVENCDPWWQYPDLLYPLLIRADGAPVGFVMIARPPYAHPTADYRLHDFFVINTCRRVGVGTQAAHTVFQRFPGAWELGYIPRNTVVQAFWRKCLAAGPCRQVEEIRLDNGLQEPDQPGFRFVTG